MRRGGGDGFGPDPNWIRGVGARGEMGIVRVSGVMRLGFGRGGGGLCGERWAGRGGLADWAGRLASWVGWPGGLGGFFFFFFVSLFFYFISFLLFCFIKFRCL